MANKNLKNAKTAKNDEFYTQWRDIETEVMQYVTFDPGVFRGKTVLLPCDDPGWVSNFTKFFVARFREFGLKRLIATSYARASKKYGVGAQLSMNFEEQAAQYNPQKSDICGKLFELRQGDTIPENPEELTWDYLEGDGDFRSPEVCALRDQADIIITNPPFSLFREFLAWIMEAGKKFLIIGNKNCVTYKEVFPLIKANKIWAGTRPWTGGMWFLFPNSDGLDGGLFNAPACWFTNLDHGRRHEPMSLMTMADNVRFNRRLKGQEYARYDNYDAIEVPYTNAIPSDYPGVMGVPITFLDKYCPEQFEIVEFRKGNDGKDLIYSELTPPLSDNPTLFQNSYSTTSIPGMIKNKEGTINGKITYARILIRHRRPQPPQP